MVCDPVEREATITTREVKVKDQVLGNNCRVSIVRQPSNRSLGSEIRWIQSTLPLFSTM